MQMQMRHVSAVLIVVASFVLAGGAGAGAATVTITRNGYVPSAVTIPRGDTVQFTNSDTVAHQIAFRTTAGVTCTPSPLVLQPAQAGSCTFATAGTYSYSDPNVRGNTFRGTVTVTEPPGDTLTIAARPLVVVYGGKTTLTGTLSSQKAGENVDVLATACGQAAAQKAATVQTTSGGAYAAVVQPLQNTTYTVRSKNVTSTAVAVKVKPRLRLGKLAPQRYSIRVFAAQTFAGKYATFQRYNGTLRRWVAVKRVLLRPNATGVAPTVISSATFRSTIRTRLRVRVVLPQAQVGACYAAGVGNTILS